MHASLHQAYHRCREVQIEPQPSHPPLPIAIVPWPHPSYRPLQVEVELQRSQGAAAEQRDALVASALHALHSIRNNLGAIHAIRPEVATPLPIIPCPLPMIPWPHRSYRAIHAIRPEVAMSLDHARPVRVHARASLMCMARALCMYTQVAKPLDEALKVQPGVMSLTPSRTGGGGGLPLSTVDGGARMPMPPRTPAGKLPAPSTRVIDAD